MSLYRKYRPAAFDDVIGNEEAVTLLRSVIEKDPPHAFLLSGPTGCGKTTLARIIARELGAEGSDFMEVDSADFRGIDFIREIRRSSSFLPLSGGKARVWLLDECHKLSNDAQNALLKGLEDPPAHAYFILATTDPQKLLPTIHGRCSKVSVTPLKTKEMFRLIRRVVKGEEETLSRDVYEQIALDSGGRPRDALQILEQALAVDPDQRLAVATKAAADQSSVIELCRALTEASSWKRVAAIMDGLRDEDPEKVRRAVLGYCAAILLKGKHDRAGVVIESFSTPVYDSGFPGLVFAAYQVIN